MDPKPFTYEHFIQAVQSLKDDMLMYYIDEAVAIYCRIKGKSVGPRPASSKDYLPEYADAFEAANYAIFITANKIGAFNLDKGAFRPYLRKALESALRDIFRVDGYETLSGSSEIENEPDTSASDAEERVRQHKDDAFETMIKFIDALPEIKRAALEKASQAGFNEYSMAEVSLGYIQARTSAKASMTRCWKPFHNLMPANSSSFCSILRELSEKRIVTNLTIIAI